MMFLRMKIKERNMIRRETHLRIPASKDRQAVAIQIRIHIIIIKALKNVPIKMIKISMEILKQKMTSSVIIQVLTQVKVNFGKKLRDNKNKANKNSTKRNNSGKIGNKKNKMIQMKNGMEDIQKKKRNFTNRTSKEIGVRVTKSMLKVPLIQMIKNTMIPIQCSIEPSFMERRYFQRRRKIMVSTHLKKILISIKRTEELMHVQIYLIINI